MARVDRSGYLTLRQGAAWVGIGTDRAAGLRLRRILERIEKRLRRRIIRREGDGHGVRLLVTKPMLRHYLPEHFDPRRQIEVVVKEHLEGLERDLKIARKERRALGARILKHETRLVALEQCTAVHGSAHAPRARDLFG
jgi:hypothetical protein